MKVRSIVVILAGSVMLYASAALVAASREDEGSTCCSDTSECGNLLCCDADSLGQPACGPGAAGYCLTTCRPH